jgi:threonine aldolase
MQTVDLRSDTVTQPTPAMREAMARAEVGDDVYGEDPTINRLQELAADLMGKEAGLFVPSGTMGNLASILAHCGRGDEAILGDKAHTFLFEAGGMAALGGVHPCQLPNQPDGTLDLEQVRSAIRPDDPHDPVTRLVALENTHNRCGGVALTPEYTRAAGELAHAHGLVLHLDGARIFNAAAALGVEACELAAPADSVTFCLSKGLSAPVGSVICGSREFIRRALRVRKQLGGGMRQAGVLAAAGIVALEEVRPKLTEDHRRARRLAEGLSPIPGLVLDAGTPATNMVFLSLAEQVPLDAAQMAQRLLDCGVKVGVVAERRFRLVTHCWVDDAGVERAVQAFDQVLSQGFSSAMI